MIALEEQNGRVPVGAERIAQAQGIDLHYAQQILQRLRKNGIVRSIRGPQGGYRLSRPAQEISLLDILVAAEGSSLEIICDSRSIGHDRCNNRAQCALSALWSELRDHIDSFLENKTLGDFAENFCDEHKVFISSASVDSPSAPPQPETL
jgi:Rrf2 family iron-sulfur cluster assembly transcriptional regulator